MIKLRELRYIIQVDVVVGNILSVLISYSLCIFDFVLFFILFIFSFSFFILFYFFIYTVPHVYIDYLGAGITSRVYFILIVRHFGTQYTYMYMQTTVIVTNGISAYLCIQNHTDRNMTIIHKFLNVILIHSCKTAS